LPQKKKQKEIMKKILTPLLLAGTLFCAAPVMAAEYISVDVDNANVRKTPSLNAPVVMELFRGYPLRVLKTEGDWYNVVDFEGDKGWIFKKITNSRQTVIVNAKNALNMRSEPSTKSKIIASVERGVVLEMLEKKGSWTKVRHSGGTVGWIYSSLLWP
ncbi:MAG: hypothetical protein CSA11_12380, partial [Chloroflexi bacterium]